MIGSTNSNTGGSLHAIAVESLSALPAKAVTGTIAIISKTPVTGVFASPKKPPEKKGMVWINTKVTGVVRIEAVRNRIDLYPAFVYQFDGSWKQMEFRIYSGGWKNSIAALFDAGDECTSLTGGWSADGKTVSGGVLQYSKSVSIIAGTNDAIDLTTISKVWFHVESLWEYRFDTYLCVFRGGSVVRQVRVPHNTGSIWMHIDVSDLTGSYQVGVHGDRAFGPDEGFTIKFSNASGFPAIYLE